MEKLPSFKVDSLGKRSIGSPLRLDHRQGNDTYDYIEDSNRVLHDITLKDFEAYRRSKVPPPSFEIAGPRSRIYFDPSKTRAAVVTCGGLCPGINDVIRAIVMELHYRYGVRNIYGIRYGYQGFVPSAGHEPMMLTPKLVSDIHKQGGTYLGSSRGNVDTGEIVDALERLNISILFTIGGDGTQHGAHEVYREIKRRKMKIAVVGIPKTIDNDIVYVDRTFGFETAFSLAVDAIASAHVEALGALNGIGLVKLMGRESGYIAANAALATNDVNFVLIPEVDFDLNGPNGFLSHLEKRVLERRHAVICVAEGVGQNWIIKDRRNVRKDASGNAKLGDIGVFLKDVISRHFADRDIPYSIKYIDPSYMIRSAPAVPNDSIFCTQLGQNAVHAGIAGKTGIIIGRWNGTFTHVPISAIINKRNHVSPESVLWWNVLESTGQPMSMKNRTPAK